MDPWGESAWTARDLLNLREFAQTAKPPWFYFAFSVNQARATLFLSDRRPRFYAVDKPEAFIWRVVACTLFIQLLLTAIGYELYLFWGMSH